MSKATLMRVVRNPRRGQIHLPNERFKVVEVMRNVDRSLLKVRWQAGGDRVIFPDELNQNQGVASSERCLKERRNKTSRRCDAPVHGFVSRIFTP